MVAPAVDPGSLTHGQQVDLLVEMERQINQLHAGQLDLIAEMDTADKASTHQLDKDWTVEDIAAALRLSPFTARDRLEFARELRRMPRLADLLRRGEITMMHARVAARETLRLDREQLETLLDRVLPRAVEQTVGQFARRVRRAVLAVDAENVEQRRARALADRRIASRPADDGMAEIYALLGAESAAAIMARVDEEGRREIPGDERSLEQRRADVFVALMLGARADGTPTIAPSIQVTVAASTLLGCDNEPGELAGHGPISAAVARELAFDPNGTWRRLLTDDEGQLLDYGRTTYRPPAKLDRFVRARDLRCRFPGCTKRAQRSHLDHITAWEDGGDTSELNLHVLCARHHHLKHEAGWSVRRRADGSTVWISPTGHRYVVPPYRYPVGDLPTARGPDPPL